MDQNQIRTEARERGKAAANALKVARRNEERMDRWTAKHRSPDTEHGSGTGLTSAYRYLG